MKISLIILPFLAVTINISAQQVERIDFEKQVKPIFVKNCSPCHFPGGKMYNRLPFDKDTTILNHQEAILKRIKNVQENMILKNFVLQNKKGLPAGKPID